MIVCSICRRALLYGLTLIRSMALPLHPTVRVTHAVGRGQRQRSSGAGSGFEAVAQSAIAGTRSVVGRRHSVTAARCCTSSTAVCSEVLDSCWLYISLAVSADDTPMATGMLSWRNSLTRRSRKGRPGGGCRSDSDGRRVVVRNGRTMEMKEAGERSVSVFTLVHTGSLAEGVQCQCCRMMSVDCSSRCMVVLLRDQLQHLHICHIPLHVHSCSPMFTHVHSCSLIVSNLAL